MEIIQSFWGCAAHLLGSILTDAILTNAKLGGASLWGADLTKAKFNDADLRGVVVFNREKRSFVLITPQYLDEYDAEYNEKTLFGKLTK